ncbi:MAG TPA: hypothetical protein VFT30_05300 [Nitrospira sp.]|nr:hypothetical protein [Nitrospira sp.]
MRFFVGVSAAFGAGTLIGVALGIISTEQKARAKYNESTQSFIRAMELARNNKPAHVEVHVHDESEKAAMRLLEGDPIVSAEPIKQADVTDFKPESNNPYHESLANPTPSWTYLEEEDYHDEDGRYKGQITIMPNESGNPIFVENDIEITDWETKIGSNILRDFYTLVEPNANPPVLYVRNNLTEEDYEVIKEVP